MTNALEAPACSFLQGIGCDRVINYKVEDVAAVLKAEYAKGYVGHQEQASAVVMLTSLR